MGRRKSAGIEISLFPFLSILCCVIGVLALLLAGVAMGQMDSGKDAEVEVALQYQDVTGTIKQSQAELEKYRTLTAEAEAIRELLADARDELQRLRQRESRVQAEQKQTEELNVRLLAEANQTRQRLTELEPELVKLQEVIAKLQKDVAAKKEPRQARVMIRPGGSGTGLRPVFVECTANDVVIHGSQKKTRVRRADLGKSPEFAELLRVVKSRPDATIIFLLRDDAVATYHAARQFARDAYVNNGKLAVVGHGELDLSLFQQGR